MKTLAIIAAAIVAVAGAAPAAAKSHYTATYDAARNVYCIKERPSGTGMVLPRTSGTRCRDKARWEQAGLTIEHRRPQQTEVAAR